ncbi:PIR protein [Plasmodium ovale]|uniref:PIR protein n=1 Tax=Plasmodium ovale TaxID=36330 RepID=A0A1D3JDY7_PLAOA|nr:PIR protein [Plasmodium ovale]
MEYIDEEYERNLPATKYFNELNNESNLIDHTESHLFLDIMNSSTPETKTIGNILYNKFLILRFRENEWNKRCSDLNHWLNLKKVDHRTIYQEKHDALWAPIEKLWVQIDEDRFPYNKCDRIYTNKSINDIQKRYALSRFCEDRDYLKNKCQMIENVKRDMDNNCLNLTKYVNKYYDVFLAQESCLPNKNNDPDNPFFISEECSLYDMTKTFPVYNIQNNPISEKDTTRTSIKLCSELEKLSPRRGGEDELNSVTLTVAETPSQNSPRNNAPYGGLALIAFLPALFYVYKFTSFGSWIRSHILKRKTLLRDIHEEEPYILSDGSPDIISTNLENKEYYLGYESM